MHISRIYKNTDLRVLTLFAVGSGFISIYLGQDRNWDLRNYHFYNAYSFLNGRLTYDIAPAQIQTFHNPLLDLPFYWMMTHLYPILCGFLIGAFQGLNAWLIYKISFVFLDGFSSTKRKRLSLFSAIVGFFGAVNLSELGTSFHDNVTSIFVLSAILIVVSSTQKDNSKFQFPNRYRLIVSGLLLGIGTGLKLPTAIYSMSFVLTIAILKASWKLRIVGILISSIGIFCGILTSLGYWAIVLWKNFHNPLFPYFNKIFQSPYYNLVNFRDDRFFPRDIYQTLFYPFFFLRNSRMVSEVVFRDFRLPLCYLLLALLMLAVLYRNIADAIPKRKHKREFHQVILRDSRGIFLISFFVLSYVFWQLSFSIYRYIVPVELLVPVFVFLAMSRIFLNKRTAYRASIILFVAVGVTTTPMHWGREPWTDSYFDVRVPGVRNLDSATVIIADREPVSYIVPYFPKNTRFVSVNNNFMRPGKTNGMQDRVRDTLQNCGDDLYLLFSQRSGEDYASILGFYYLRMDGEEKEKVVTKLDDHLYLVSVSRTR